MTLPALAQQLASHGRYGDTTLVHMNPREVRGLASLGAATGRHITINPDTGLPEAFSFLDFIPAIAGIVAGTVTGNPLIGAAAAGATGAGKTAIQGGSLTDSLLSGVISGVSSYAGGELLKGGLDAAQAAAQPALQAAADSAAASSAISSGAASAIPAGDMAQAAMASEGLNPIALNQGFATNSLGSIPDIKDIPIMDKVQSAFNNPKEFGEGLWGAIKESPWKAAATGAGLLGVGAYQPPPEAPEKKKYTLREGFGTPTPPLDLNTMPEGYNPAKEGEFVYGFPPPNPYALPFVAGPTNFAKGGPVKMANGGVIPDLYNSDLYNPMVTAMGNGVPNLYQMANGGNLYNLTPMANSGTSYNLTPMPIGYNPAKQGEWNYGFGNSPQITPTGELSAGFGNNLQINPPVADLSGQLNQPLSPSNNMWSYGFGDNSVGDPTSPGTAAQPGGFGLLGMANDIANGQGISVGQAIAGLGSMALGLPGLAVSALGQGLNALGATNSSSDMNSSSPDVVGNVGVDLGGMGVDLGGLAGAAAAAAAGDTTGDTSDAGAGETGGQGADAGQYSRGGRITRMAYGGAVQPTGINTLGSNFNVASPVVNQTPAAQVQQNPLIGFDSNQLNASSSSTSPTNQSMLSGRNDNLQNINLPANPTTNSANTGFPTTTPGIRGLSPFSPGVSIQGTGASSNPLGMAKGGLASKDRGMTKNLIDEATAALLGEHPRPQEAIRRFTDMFGTGALSVLKDKINGGRITGAGGALDDLVPGTIEGKQQVRLADGEFVVPGDVVSGLGDGSTDQGVRKLKEMMARVRQDRTGKTTQPKRVNDARVMPA